MLILWQVIHQKLRPAAAHPKVPRHGGAALAGEPSAVEARVPSQPPNLGGVQGPICPVMVLRTSVQVRMIFPLLFLEQWEGLWKQWGLPTMMGLVQMGWGRGRSGPELIGALQAWGVVPSPYLCRKGWPQGLPCSAYMTLTAHSGLTTIPLVPSTYREPLWSSGLLWSRGVDLFSVSQSRVIGTWDDFRWFLDMVLKSSERQWKNYSLQFLSVLGESKEKASIWS